MATTCFNVEIGKNAEVVQQQGNGELVMNTQNTAAAVRNPSNRAAPSKAATKRPTKAQIEAERLAAIAAAEEAEIDEQVAEDVARSNSVVSAKYKQRYAERALAAKSVKGVAKKVVARSNGDWLALTIAKLCVGEKNKLNVGEFEKLLDANGVSHAHWNRTSPGWQGRLRMTGRLALQRVVAEADGELELPDGTSLIAPKVWVAKYQH